MLSRPVWETLAKIIELVPWPDDTASGRPEAKRFLQTGLPKKVFPLSGENDYAPYRASHTW